MRISLRAGEKLYLNGAVFRVDRKVSIELMNDVTFLLESHVMQAGDATSPLRQVYFAVQLMLMDPGDAHAIERSAERMFSAFLEAAEGLPIADDVAAIRDSFRRGRLIETLKALRAAFPNESALMSGRDGSSRRAVGR
ncbi:MAG: flagellar biosynthesis repressor FlbT [Hyphomicrobiales bacterium]|nr:flagellar biosynthesis repressor FlbT [Hyphomicrobiales bacterium]